jgi:O-acetyl-ADP-ribose deacetylase (regulator of RNase III)
MKVVLAALSPALAAAWSRAFEGVADVRVHAGSLFDVECDAFVSPANSFGFMDGGIDANLCDRFGGDLQRRVQERIRSTFNGELLVGQALIVPTGDARVPFVISAPTMRVPMNVAQTANAYPAARAVFLLVQLGNLEDGRPVHEVVRTVAFPGLGTGIGQMPADACAVQMRAAYDDYVAWTHEFPPTLMRAAQRHCVDFRGE